MKILPVEGLPEFGDGMDIVSEIESVTTVKDGDVVCVASTIVSKVEGRTADLEDYQVGERAEAIAERRTSADGTGPNPRLVEAVLSESEEVLIESPFLLSVTHFGHVGVNAGIDRSNTGPADLLLLPEDPGASADRIRRRASADVSVIVTDTSGRPFRRGQRGVAIGWSGIPAGRDYRGETDRDGHTLEVTVESVVDELAAASNLLQGEGDDGTPVVVIRGFEFGDHGETDSLFRDPDTDYVRAALREWTIQTS
ncbi:MAG: coenzyme F420-0:L-glutamate ligase [Halodesulfurarchaeum sp.]